MKIQLLLSRKSMLRQAVNPLLLPDGGLRNAVLAYTLFRVEDHRQTKIKPKKLTNICILFTNYFCNLTFHVPIDARDTMFMYPVQPLKLYKLLLFIPIIYIEISEND